MDVTNSPNPVSNETIKSEASSNNSGTLHSILINNSKIKSNLPSTSSANPDQPSSNNPTQRTQSMTNQASINYSNHILTKSRLQDLVKEIDPCEQLDDEVEELLLQMVDDFVNSTVGTACVFAKHRNSSTVEAKDVQLYLDKTYQMWLPGFGTEDVKPYKKPPTTEAHKQRLALIRKSLRKY